MGIDSVDRDTSWCLVYSVANLEDGRHFLVFVIGGGSFLKL